MSDLSIVQAHQFDDIEQQHDASWIGMWVFLGTEVMFFGGMFTGYTLYRNAYPQAFASASNHLDIWLGTINTAVLICSSFTMALAVRSAQLGERKPIINFLLLTILLGAFFLGIKFTEYYFKFEEHLVPGAAFNYEASLARPAEIFFSFYFAMTGMHALLVILYFMHTRYSSRLTWVFAGAGFFWLMILIGGTMDDFLTRNWFGTIG